MANFSQQVIWTALPNGLNRKRLRVSVAVSPRLVVDGASTAALSRFPEWLDWPKTLASTKFSIRFGRKTLGARIVSRPNTEIWRAIFTPRTIVIGHVFEDLSGRTMISYSVADMARRLRDIYASFAGASPDMPDVEGLRTALHQFALAPSGPDLLKTLSGPGAKGYLGELAKAGVADLGRFHGYHAPVSDQPGQSPTSEDAKSLLQGIDFHKLVAALGQYGRLLRDTGLVVDLELEDTPPAGDAQLSVIPRWPTSGAVDTAKDITPRLMTRFDGKRFEAVAKGDQITGRRLDLSDKRFTPVQVDIDGGIIKLSGTGQNLRTRKINAQQQGGKHEKEVEPIGLPTLRTAGIMIAEEGRADGLSSRLARAGKFEAMARADKAISLFAEDVNRGYHFDVEHNKQWHSLCRVDVSYALNDRRNSLDDRDVEGIVQLGATEAPPGAPPELANMMRLSEGLFQWDGWSLSAPRPGLALDQSGAPRRTESELTLPVSAEERVHPGSLPRLRFGASYRIRARLADLAHNAESWSAGDAKGASKPITFRRFEPVAPPVPALVRAQGTVDTPSDGASLLRLVIRSFDAHLQTPTPDTEARMLLAPRTSVEMAERHGVLDGDDGKPRADRYALLAGRDDDLDTVQAGPASDRKTYPVSVAGTGHAPWLPDPMATHVQVSLLSDPPRFVTSGNSRIANEAGEQIGPGEGWPDQTPWILKLHEDPGDALPFVASQGVDLDLNARMSWDTAARTLSVALPKGEVVRARLSHVFPGKPEPADLWGIAAWLKEHLGIDAYAQMAVAINAGRHWAFTPALDLELVHAVQRPLVQPAPHFAPPQRARGDTHAVLSLGSPCHAESTSDLALAGVWVEAVDTGSGLPAAGWQGGQAFRQALDDRASPTGTIDLTGRHAFGDTRYRRVSYRLKGTSRFAEYFPPALRNDPESISVVSDDVVVHVPNAAPPPPPLVSRSVPVFDWLRKHGTTRKASWRRSGIRVYLERPWFQTGFGEMLAAVLPQPGLGSSAFDGIAEHVTRWAGDPIWLANGAEGRITTSAPDLDAFPTRAQPDDGPDERWPSIFPDAERGLSGGNPDFTDLSLPDDNGNTIATVHAAGHPVSWDAGEARYYSDLMMRTGHVYQPFVSLALARLHPVSVPGCHLSPVVRTEPMQILPERLAVVRHTSTGWVVQVFGHPHGYIDGHGAAGQDRPKQSVIRAEVQRTERGDPDELDWEVVEDTALAAAPHVALVNPATSMVLPVAFTPTYLFSGQAGALRDGVADFAQARPKRLYSRRIKTPGAGGGSAGTARWRIRVAEWERHAADFASGVPGKNPGSSERLIFAETFEI